MIDVLADQQDLDAAKQYLEKAATDSLVCLSAFEDLGRLGYSISMNDAGYFVLGGDGGGWRLRCFWTIRELACNVCESRY